MLYLISGNPYTTSVDATVGGCGPRSGCVSGVARTPARESGGEQRRLCLAVGGGVVQVGGAAAFAFRPGGLRGAPRNGWFVAVNAGVAAVGAIEEACEDRLIEDPARSVASEPAGAVERFQNGA
jgi:hypothetical protein